MNRDIMVAIAIARGIGEMPLVGGMTWGFGDDWVWQFRRVEDRIQVVRRRRSAPTKGRPRKKRSIYLTPTAFCSVCRSSPRVRRAIRSSI